MLPTMEDTLSEHERKLLIKSTIQLQSVKRYTDPADLLVQLERWGAWLINGSAWLMAPPVQAPTKRPMIRRMM